MGTGGIMSKTTIYEANNVIDGLGGTRTASAYFGVSEVTICNWRNLGIPNKSLLQLYGRSPSQKPRIRALIARGWLGLDVRAG
jgi:hypothetical protein